MSNKIDLMNHSPSKIQGNESTEKGNSERLNVVRPDKLAVSKIISQNQKWRQCKIIGKNLSIRSYSAACAFEDIFYVYGGYQMLNGMMKDFYCMDISDEAQKFDWISIEATGDLPGPRAKHSLVSSKQKIFLVCGLYDSINSSNQIYAFDPKSKVWEKIKYQGQQLPHLDSFCCDYVNQNNEQKIIIGWGYDSSKADYVNSVYQYSITTNKVSLLFENYKQIKQGTPVARSGSASATDGKNIYMFGGKNFNDRYNDLWEFSLTNYKFTELQKNGDIPTQRNGHTMNFFEDKLYVFGGIHDITWELDDLHVYNLKKKIWTTLEQDSPRKVERKKVQNESVSKQKLEKKPKKKNWYETVNSLSQHHKSSYYNQSSPGHKNTRYMQQNQSISPGKMIQQQKKKAFLNKKNNLLKNFAVDKKQAKEYIALQSQSQAIRNSLDVIGNPDPKTKVTDGRLTEFGKETQSKFLQPLSNNSNIIIGKKPCARDGHCSTIIGQQIIIFGGDRHKMSFNDIHKLNFGIVGRQKVPNKEQ